MAQTPNKSDAKGGAGVIRLYPHKSTERAIAKAQERLDKGQLSKRGHRLTGKQEIFSQRIVDGLTQADAIRAAYDVSNSSDQAIYVMGCKAMANPKIVERVAEIRAARDRVTSLDGVALKAFVIERLKIEAEEAKQDGARVRALELIGKLTEVQAFADVSIDRTPKRTEAEIEADIKDLLEHLRPGPQAG